MICHHCAQQAPRGAFCTFCGNSIHDAAANDRQQHFAAHPGEHVAQPSVFTTLLPHAHPARLHEFRLALVGGLVIVLGLAATGFIAGALLASAILVPALYVVYMYEHRVFGDAPVIPLVGTILGGAILGAAVMLIAQQTVGEIYPYLVFPVVLLGVVIPLIQIPLVAFPALLLSRKIPAGAINLLSAGVCSGLGYAAGEGIARFVGVFPVLSVRSTAAGWTYALVSSAVLLPLFHAACGGVLVIALRKRLRGPARRLQIGAVVLVAASEIAYYAGAMALANQGAGNTLVGIYQAMVAVAVLIVIRFLVHHAMLSENTDLTLRPQVCHHCGYNADFAGFCPHCGAASRIAALGVA